ncbi:MAG: hypothetical protein FWH26_03750 [Oscillospiraceae bacterium]|nr:hypothetical protein [Oscillospiraceae bacterium]
MKRNLRIILAALLAAALLLAFAGCGAAEADPTETSDASPSIQSSSEISPETSTEAVGETAPPAGSDDLVFPLDLTDISNFLMLVDGKKYTVGDPFSKFAADFELARLQADIGETILDQDRKISVSFMKPGGGYVYASVINRDKEDKPVKDCNTASLSSDQFEVTKYDCSFVGGIIIGKTTMDEIKTLFGDPTQTFETDSTIRWDFSPKKDYAIINYSVSFEKATGVLTKVDMQYIV